MDGIILGLGLMQVVLPIVLIIANTSIPSGSWLGLGLRSAALAMMLLYDALAGLWLFPPWWTPYLLMGLLAVGVTYRYRRTRPLRRGWIGLSEQVAGLLALAGTLALLFAVYQGRSAPSGTVDLAMPLGPGRYLVLSGGTTETINPHLFTLTVERARAFRGQSHAIDIIGIDRFGLRSNGILPADPSAYFIYGAPVLAPCAGTVAHVIDGVADMQVPQMDRANMTGNSVMLDCDGNFVLLAHLAPNSIAVAQDQLVAVGTRIGLIGNSGNSGNSGEPHLHIHVQNALPKDDPISAEPLWFTLDGRFPVRNDRILVR